MNDIRISNLSFSYGKQRIFSGFCADFCAGRVKMIFGPSGSGKTTLLRLLLGLITPSGGEITGLHGQNIAAVFQEDRLAMQLTAPANAALALPAGFPHSEITRQLLAAGLPEESFQQPVSEYSGGMRRRAALVRAVVTGWPVIVMDEPFKGLDAAAKLQTAAYIKAETAGKTLMIVSHDEEDAKLFSADILRIGGK